MSQAEELLNTLTTDEITPLLADSDTEPHIVIGDDRIIVVPDELKRIAVQYDHDIETVTFDCPRYWDGLDMSEMNIYINYIRRDMIKGMYPAKNVVVDTDNDRIMHFDWTISRHVSTIKGPIKFLICIRKVDDEGIEENHWNSELNEETYISEGLECDDALFDPYPDIISEWIVDIKETKRVLLEMKESSENASKSEAAARESEELADDYWQMAKSYAVGGTGVREGEDMDNAKYYSDITQNIHHESLTLLSECEQSLADLNARIVDTKFSVNYETGNLEYISQDYSFSVNTETGNLEWHVNT